MPKLRQHPHGSSSSHRPRGMSTARFTSTEADVEQQFEEAAGEETGDSQDWPDYGNGNPKAATQGQDEASTSKSKGKTGDQPQQSEEGAETPPEENPPAPEPSNLKPGTSNDDPTSAPAEVPTKDPTQDPTQTTSQRPRGGKSTQPY